MAGLHNLDFSGTQQRDFGRGTLQLEDFGLNSDWDSLNRRQQREVSDNFLGYESRGTPPEDFEELWGPVVNPHGSLDPSDDKLSKAALQDADRLDRFFTNPDRMDRRINRLRSKHFR